MISGAVSPEAFFLGNLDLSTLPMLDTTLPAKIRHSSTYPTVPAMPCPKSIVDMLSQSFHGAAQGHRKYERNVKCFWFSLFYAVLRFQSSQLWVVATWVVFFLECTGPYARDPAEFMVNLPPRLCLRTPTWSAICQVNSLRSFISNT